MVTNFEALLPVQVGGCVAPYLKEIPPKSLRQVQA
jgi:hypothetical protein